MQPCMSFLAHDCSALEELRVLLLELLPHESCEARLDLRVLLKRVYHLLLIEVELRGRVEQPPALNAQNCCRGASAQDKPGPRAVQAAGDVWTHLQTPLYEVLDHLDVSSRYPVLLLRSVLLRVAGPVGRPRTCVCPVAPIPAGSTVLVGSERETVPAARAAAGAPRRAGLGAVAPPDAAPRQVHVLTSETDLLQACAAQDNAPPLRPGLRRTSPAAPMPARRPQRARLS